MKLKAFLDLLRGQIETGNGTDEVRVFSIPVRSIHLSEFKPRGWVFEAPRPDGDHNMDIKSTYDTLHEKLLKGEAKEDDLIIIKSGITNSEVEANHVIHKIGSLSLTNSHVTS